MIRSTLIQCMPFLCGVAALCPTLRAQILVPYSEHFTDKALRINLYQTRDARSEILTIDTIYEEPLWPERKAQQTAPFNEGRYMLEVCDPASNTLLYARGFDTMFAEYKTTTPALDGVQRVFQRSVRIPEPLWDKRTGRIDREVTLYMRDHGYDLRYYIETNWKGIGPKLVGKLHFQCGDMDNFYLNTSLYMLEDFLRKTDNPAYEGSFEWGRPMKGHGWISMPVPDLLRLMADHARKNAPVEDDSSSWQYK